MKHQRAFKYRFYPTPEQVDLLSKTFGCARYIYNWGLQLKSDAWTLRQERVSYADMAKQLAILKKQDETAWLNEVSSVALQQSLRHLDTGFKNFFAGLTGYPHFMLLAGQSFQPLGQNVPRGIDAPERIVQFRFNLQVR